MGCKSEWDWILFNEIHCLNFFKTFLSSWIKKCKEEARTFSYSWTMMSARKLLPALWNHKGNEMDVNSDKAKVPKDLGPLEHHLASELEELEAAPTWGYYMKSHPISMSHRNLGLEWPVVSYFYSHHQGSLRVYEGSGACNTHGITHSSFFSSCLILSGLWAPITHCSLQSFL